MEKKTVTLYKKVGRKYVPFDAYWDDCYKTDRMRVGTFRLAYAYQDGGRMYQYDVTPSTAPMVAAMMIAKKAMEEAINESSKNKPSLPAHYTKRQLALIEQFKSDMGGMYPSWWTENSSHEISNAAIKAVLEYKP